MNKRTRVYDFGPLLVAAAAIILVCVYDVNIFAAIGLAILPAIDLKFTVTESYR